MMTSFLKFWVGLVIMTLKKVRLIWLDANFFFSGFSESSLNVIDHKRRDRWMQENSHQVSKEAVMLGGSLPHQAARLKLLNILIVPKRRCHRVASFPNNTDHSRLIVIWCNVSNC